MRTIYKDFKGVNKGEWQRSVSQEQTMEDHQFQLDMTAIFFRDRAKKWPGSAQVESRLAPFRSLIVLALKILWFFFL